MRADAQLPRSATQDNIAADAFFSDFDGVTAGKLEEHDARAMIPLAVLSIPVCRNHGTR
jgi:hypothetical protein